MPKRVPSPLESVPVEVADLIAAAHRAVLAVDVHAGNLLRAANESRVDPRIQVLIETVARAAAEALVAADLASGAMR